MRHRTVATGRPRLESSNTGNRSKPTTGWDSNRDMIEEILDFCQYR